MRLASKPTADVTIPVRSEDRTEGTVEPSSLTFTPDDWEPPQTITVTGVNDDEDDGDVSYVVALGPSTSADEGWAGLSSSTALVNIDDDDAAILTSAISGPTTESGGTATFTIRLATMPTAPVTIPIRSNDTTEGTVSPSSVTFAPAEWNTPKTVTVTGVDDSAPDGDVSYGIVFDAATSADPAYAGLRAPTVTVKNVDNETTCASSCAWNGDDFEDGTITDWTQGTQTAAVVSGAGAAGSSKFLQITGGSGTITAHFKGVRRDTTPCQPSRVSVWLNHSTTAEAGTYFVFGDASTGTGGAALGVLFLHAGDEGNWEYVNGPPGPPKSAGAVVPNTWTHFVFDLNWSTKKMNIIRDGVTVATNTPFRVPSSENVSRYFFYTYGANTTSRSDQLLITCSYVQLSRADSA